MASAPLLVFPRIVFHRWLFYLHENRLSSRIRQRISLDMNNIPFSGLVSDVYIPYSVDFSSSAG